MTRLFGFAVLAVGGYLVANRMKKKMAAVEKKLSEAAAKAPGAVPIATLVLDSETGKYKPKRS